MSNQKRYVYCWIRKDLPVVQQIIQLGHVCYEMGMSLATFNYERDNSCHFVLFEVADEEELASVATDLRNLLYIQDQVKPFYEDSTGEYTAICTCPFHEDDYHRKDFAKYRMYI